MTIGQLSKKTGLSIQAIRYYESIKLLPKPKKKDSGFRLYDRSYVDKIVFIRKAKEMKFTLAEIKSILNCNTCFGVHDTVFVKLNEVREKLKEYKSLEKELKKLLKTCPYNDSADNCLIIKYFHSKLSNV